jgi:hypothetical protein
MIETAALFPREPSSAFDGQQNGLPAKPWLPRPPVPMRDETPVSGNLEYR